MTNFPYSEKYPINYELPENGTDPSTVIEILHEIAGQEDSFWETGKCSGTMYCGDHEHYDFLTKAFGMFAHVNALQRDMCPGVTKFESEIISMTLNMLNAGEIKDTIPGGLVTSGGSASIAHAILAYREYARDNLGIKNPNVIKPETAHPAFDKACHLFGVDIKIAPVNKDTFKVDTAWVDNNVDENTVAIIGSACNYGYGIVDPIGELSDIALAHKIGLHVDGCLGGFILPFGQQLGYDIETFDFRVPGVTTISADTHKYGYALKGTSVLSFRDKNLRNSQYFYLTEWSGGKYCSPGMDGSRSAGLIAATWASMVKLGKSGYRKYAEQIFNTAEQLKDVVRSHKELRILGNPSFLFSFTSDEFDIYHVNDSMVQNGWRFNGQQYPNAIHMAVTRPQTQPGVVEAFAKDLAQAVQYAKDHKNDKPLSGAIYGGVAEGMTPEADEVIKMFMAEMMDGFQQVPPRI